MFNPLLAEMSSADRKFFNLYSKMKFSNVHMFVKNQRKICNSAILVKTSLSLVHFYINYVTKRNRPNILEITTRSDCYCQKL